MVNLSKQEHTVKKDLSKEEMKFIINRKQKPKKSFKEKVREFHEFENRVPKLGSYQELKIKQEIQRRKVMKLWRADKTNKDIRTLNNLFQNRGKMGKQTVMVEFAKNSETEEEEGDKEELNDQIDDLEIDEFQLPNLIDMRKSKSFMIRKQNFKSLKS